MLDASGILPHEQVDVLNISTGARFTTYAIEAPRGSCTIGVNGGAPISGDLPFGGYKHSGIGRAWGVPGIEEYLETKVIGYRD